MARVSELIYGCEGEPLYVRVLRKWIPSSKSSDTWFLTVDRHGDAIQILGSKVGQQYIEDKLRVGKCYKILDYTCTETQPYLDVINNGIHLNVGPASTINEISCEEDFPNTWFNFISIDNLSTVCDKIDEYADIIGYLKEAKICKKHNEEKFVRVSLTTETGDELSIALWKDCAETYDRFDPAILNLKPSNTIVAVTSVKVTTYSGKPSLCSSFATHVYINPPLAYTDLLKAKYETNLTQATYSISSIASLLEMNYDSLFGRTIHIKGTISQYICNNCWYNAFCSKCPNSIPKKGVHWFCTTHAQISDPDFRFSLSAIVEDTCSRAELHLSDDVCQNICGFKCNQVIQEFGSDNRKTVPPVFDQTHGHEYVFHVQLMRNSKRKYLAYVAVKADKVTPNPETPLPTTPTLSPLPTETPTTSTIKSPISEKEKTSLNLQTPMPSTPTSTPPPVETPTKSAITSPNSEKEKTSKVGKRLSFNEPDYVEVPSPSKRERYPN